MTHTRPTLWFFAALMLFLLPVACSSGQHTTPPASRLVGPSTTVPKATVPKATVPIVTTVTTVPAGTPGQTSPVSFTGLVAAVDPQAGVLAVVVNPETTSATLLLVRAGSATVTGAATSLDRIVTADSASITGTVRRTGAATAYTASSIVVTTPAPTVRTTEPPRTTTTKKKP